MPRIDIASIYHLLFGQFTNILHTKCLIHTFIFFLKLIENDKFSMAYVFTTFNDTSMNILSYAYIIGVITFASSSTEYPVKLVDTIKSANKECCIGILLQMMHRKILLWNLIVWSCFHFWHYILWQCLRVNPKRTLGNIESLA